MILHRYRFCRCGEGVPRKLEAFASDTDVPGQF
jgi:hypothetical protein